jgi:stress-induced morphogen
MNTRIEQWKTAESNMVEAALRVKFPSAEAYRYNSASIRVRVIDPKFEGLSLNDRENMVLPIIRSLDPKIQGDIVLLLTLTPSETQSINRKSLVNMEFEDPSPSLL